MKRLLLLFVPLFLSATSNQELTIEIIRRFNAYNECLKTVTISPDEFSESATIEQLKKIIASKAGISLKKLNVMILRDAYTHEILNDGTTCEDNNIKERNYLCLELPPHNALVRFFRKVAMLPGAAFYAIAHKFIP